MTRTQKLATAFALTFFAGLSIGVGKSADPYTMEKLDEIERAYIDQREWGKQMRKSFYEVCDVNEKLKMRLSKYEEVIDYKCEEKEISKFEGIPALP